MRHKINKTNAFDKARPENIKLTKHFVDRWNERVPSIPFQSNEDMKKYLELMCRYRGVDYIDGDFYVIDDIILTVDYKKDSNSLLFITVYGTITDNPILYNILITQGEKGVRKVQREYGKINIVPENN